MQEIIKIDLDLAAKIIREALSYAEKLSFRPPSDFREAALLLTGANPDAAGEEIPTGRNGKPYFVAGPHDNVPHILAKLDKAVGPGNYEYFAPMSQPPAWDQEDEDFMDFEEEDEDDFIIEQENL
jgi:hypothetical protein